MKRKFWCVLIIFLMLNSWLHYLWSNNQTNVRSNNDKIIALRWSDLYCVYGNFLRKSVSDETITLLLHSSDDRIDLELFSQIQNWNACVSLSVVLPALDDVMLDDSASSVWKKFSTAPAVVRTHLSVHLILPISPSVKCPNLALHNFNYARENTTLAPSSFLNSYPANVARNVARYFTVSKYIVIADLDHHFSKNFELKMRKLASEIIGKFPKTVLVYRIFEVSTNVKRKTALTKLELKQLLQKNAARVFHSSFGRGHRIPYFREWLLSNSESGVQFYTNYTVSEWEPQFVSNNEIPLHDENFPYPCKDNTVLRWEMCRAGYNFAIVNDVFMYHKGFKSIMSKITIDRRRHRIQRKAYSALTIFRKRMKKIYPQTNHACPRFHV